MASDKKPFIATDELQHRYADSEVLRKALQVMGFKDKDIDISVRNVSLPRGNPLSKIDERINKQGSESDGLRVNLPKQLTDVCQPSRNDWN